MSFTYENFLDELIAHNDKSQINPNITYNDVFNNYNYNNQEFKNQVINANLDCSFDNVILNETNYKKIVSASFNQQYSKLLKQDEQYKEMIFHLQSNIDNTYYSNVAINDKEIKIDKIEKDLTSIYGNILFYDKKFKIAEMHYNYLKSTKLYHILYDFYLKYGHRYYKTDGSNTITWNINNVSIVLENGIDNILLTIGGNTITISNNELFNERYNNLMMCKYAVIPIVQILYYIDSIEDKSKWYIILHKLIKIHKIFIKKYFPE
jgi:hypothetical protein